jgi:hypothetical protein
MAGLMERRRVFEGEWLSSIEWVPVRARRDRGRTELVDFRGAPAEVLSGDRHDAREWHQRLDRFLEDSRERELVIEERVSPAGLVTAAVLLAWLFLVLRGLIRTTGRYEVLVDQAAGRIVVRATRLGLFSFNRVLPLEGLRGIDVAHGLLRRQHHPRGNEGEPAAKVRLEYDDAIRYLTPRQLPGSEVHEDLAERLRQVAGLEPEAWPAVVGEEEQGSPDHKSWQGWAIYLVLLVPVGAIVLAFSLKAAFDDGGVPVRLRAERSCRFQNTELLPGAEMRIQLEPGSYTVEIFDPEGPDEWRTDRFEVRQDEARTYVCR